MIRFFLCLTALLYSAIAMGQVVQTVEFPMDGAPNINVANDDFGRGEIRRDVNYYAIEQSVDWNWSAFDTL